MSARPRRLTRRGRVRAGRPPSRHADGGDDPLRLLPPGALRPRVPRQPPGSESPPPPAVRLPCPPSRVGGRTPPRALRSRSRRRSRATSGTGRAKRPRPARPRRPSGRCGAPGPWSPPYRPYARRPAPARAGRARPSAAPSYPPRGRRAGARPRGFPSAPGPGPRTGRCLCLADPTPTRVGHASVFDNAAVWQGGARPGVRAPPPAQTRASRRSRTTAAISARHPSSSGRASRARSPGRARS